MPISQKKVISATSTSIKTTSCSTSKQNKAVRPKRVIKSKKLEDISTPTAKSCTEATKRATKKNKKITQSETIQESSKSEKENIIENCGDREYGVGRTVYKIGGKNADMFYKNEMFTSSSSNTIKSHQLNTKESEKISEDTEPSASKMSSLSSTQDVRFVNTSDPDIFDHIKQFRTQNYFECHSLKPRSEPMIKDENHKCSYRFYLNERLFPTPLSCSTNGEVRCVECHLPINSNPDKEINAYLQAKVSISNKVLDVTMLLPLKKEMIIGEKRREKEKEIVYFGVLKMDGGISLDENQPNSLALRHEKGFKRFQDDNRYAFEPVEDDDVVIF